jgi:hypothetical protein
MSALEMDVILYFPDPKAKGMVIVQINVRIADGHTGAYTQQKRVQTVFLL